MFRSSISWIASRFERRAGPLVPADSFAATACCRRIRWNGTESITPISRLGRVAVVALETLDQPIDGFHIMIPEPAAQCIREQLLAQTTIEIALAVGDEDMLEFLDRS